MIRTKYLVIAMCASLLCILSASVWSVTDGMSASFIQAHEEVLFATPQDTYRVAPRDSGNRTDERKAFIAEVQKVLADTPVRVVEDFKQEPEPVPQEVITEVPLPVATIVEPVIIIPEIQSSTTTETSATGTVAEHPQLVP